MECAGPFVLGGELPAAGRLVVGGGEGGEGDRKDWPLRRTVEMQSSLREMGSLRQSVRTDIAVVGALVVAGGGWETRCGDR